MLDGSKSRVKSAQVVGLIRKSHVKNQVSEWQPLRHFDGPLDFVHGVDAPSPLQVSNGNRIPARSAPIKIGVKGGVERMKFNALVAKPLGHVANVVLVLIVKVLAGGEHFKLPDSGTDDLVHEVGG